MIKVNVRRKRNPTDKEFLKTIFVDKDYDNLYHTVEYFIYRNEDTSKRDRFGTIPRAFAIASAYYDTKDKWVYDVSVNPSYQRKGLATYLYNYIEQDQKVKLKPSDYLLEPGKAFWKNRLKNPRDDDFLAKVNIVKYNLKNSPYANYVAYLNNREVVSEASFDRESKKVELIRTEDKYKRKGLANLIYDYIEEDQKIKLKLEDGEAFWKARIKKSNPNDGNITPDKIKLIRVKGTRGRGGDKGGESWRIEVDGEKAGVVFINLIDLLIFKIGIKQMKFFRNVNET